MKVYKRGILAALMASIVILLPACGAASVQAGSTEQKVSPWFTEPRSLEKNDSFESKEYYIENTKTGRHIYALETKPEGIADGEKIPVVIYTHGQSGYATNFYGIYSRLAQEKIAAFSFECCGGNRSGAKSEGSKLFPAHYTSRITDLETILEKVKTLDYVDTDRIFLFGESYGGITSSLVAARHNEIAGLILLSTGISDEMMKHEEGDSTYIKEEDTDDPNETIKEYKGNVILFNGEQDFAYESGKKQIDTYNQRSEGSAEFYSLANSNHSFSELSDEGKEFVITTMIEFVGGKKK